MLIRNQAYYAQAKTMAWALSVTPVRLSVRTYFTYVHMSVSTTSAL